jgi:hypothetical protein
MNISKRDLQLRAARNDSESSTASQPPRYEDTINRNFHLSVVQVPMLEIPLTRAQKLNMSNSLLDLNKKECVDDSSMQIFNETNVLKSLKNSTSEPLLMTSQEANEPNFFFQNNLLKIGE